MSWPKAKLMVCHDGIIRPLLSLDETAAHLGVSRRTLDRIGCLRRFRIGRRVFVTAGSVYQADSPGGGFRDV